MGSTQFYQRAPSNLAVDSSGATSQTGNSTIGGNETVGGTLGVAGAATLGAGVGVTGSASASTYVNAPQMRIGTVPNGANGPCLAISPNGAGGAIMATVNSSGAFTGNTCYLGWNRFVRSITAASGFTATNYDNGGAINVSFAGAVSISMPSLVGASYTNGLLGMEVTLVATNAATAITVTLGNAADQFLVPGAAPGTAGTGTMTNAAGNYGTISFLCIAPNLWLARPFGAWTKT